MKKTCIIFFGRYTPDKMLAGEIRVLNITRAFEQAAQQAYDKPILYRVDKVYSLRLFLTYLIRHPRFVLLLLDPRLERSFVVYHFLSPRMLNIMKRFGRLRFYDFDDDPSRLLREYSMKHTPEEYDLLENLREHAFKEFETIIFTGEHYAADYTQIPREKILVLPNGSDPDHIHYSGPASGNVIGMVGGTSPGRGILEFIEACKLVKKEVPDLQLNLALDSVENRGNLSEIMTFIRDTEWIHTFQVDYSGVSDFLATLRIGIIPYRDTPLMNIVMPLKLFDYMAAGKPIVSTRLLQIREVLDEAQAGVATGFTPEEMAKGIVRLLKVADDDLLQYGQRGRKAVENHYAWSHNTPLLKDFLTSSRHDHF